MESIAVSPPLSSLHSAHHLSNCPHRRLPDPRHPATCRVNFFVSHAMINTKISNMSWVNKQIISVTESGDNNELSIVLRWKDEVATKGCIAVFATVTQYHIDEIASSGPLMILGSTITSDRIGDIIEFETSKGKRTIHFGKFMCNWKHG